MIPKIEENPPVGTHTGIPTTDNASPLSHHSTLYDYFALFPVLITAVTPLILGLRKKQSCKNKDDEI